MYVLILYVQADEQALNLVSKLNGIKHQQIISQLHFSHNIHIDVCHEEFIII